MRSYRLGWWLAKWCGLGCCALMAAAWLYSLHCYIICDDGEESIGIVTGRILISYRAVPLNGDTFMRHPLEWSRGNYGVHIARPMLWYDVVTTPWDRQI